jgi:hypothetical protein
MSSHVCSNPVHTRCAEIPPWYPHHRDETGGSEYNPYRYQTWGHTCHCQPLNEGGSNSMMFECSILMTEALVVGGALVVLSTRTIATMLLYSNRSSHEILRYSSVNFCSTRTQTTSSTCVVGLPPLGASSKVDESKEISIDLRSTKRTAQIPRNASLELGTVIGVVVESGCLCDVWCHPT